MTPVLGVSGDRTLTGQGHPAYRGGYQWRSGVVFCRAGREACQSYVRTGAFYVLLLFDGHFVTLIDIWSRLTGRHGRAR